MVRWMCFMLSACAYAVVLASWSDPPKTIIPVVQGPPQLRSFTSSDGKITGWKIETPGKQPLQTPAIVEGKVFLAGGQGSYSFYAFDAATGQPLWTYRTADAWPLAPVVANGKIAFNTESCELEVISMNGASLWKRWLGDPLRTIPAIAGNALYVAYPDSRGDGKHHAAAFELDSGHELWTRPLPGEVITAPVIDRDRLHLATLDGSLLALDHRDGGNIWRERRNVNSAPAVSNGRVYVALSAPKATSAGLSPRTMFSSNPSIYRDSVYGPVEDRVQRVDPRTGRVIWTRTLRQGDIITPPSIVNGKVFVGTMSGNVYALSAETGSILWQVALGEPVDFQPAIAHGRVYVATDRGSLFALNTGDALDDGWPMWGGGPGHNGGTIVELPLFGGI
jgi:eukaryotic-like serine/threonine-protein kinase